MSPVPRPTPGHMMWSGSSASASVRRERVTGINGEGTSGGPGRCGGVQWGVLCDMKLPQPRMNMVFACSAHPYPSREFTTIPAPRAGMGVCIGVAMSRACSAPSISTLSCAHAWLV